MERWVKLLSVESSTVLTLFLSSTNLCKLDGTSIPSSFVNKFSESTKIYHNNQLPFEIVNYRIIIIHTFKFGNACKWRLAMLVTQFLESSKTSKRGKGIVILSPSCSIIPKPRTSILLWLSLSTYKFKY